MTMITTRDFIEFMERVTADGSTFMLLRTTGPNACTDEAKVNEIYSVYKTEFDVEDTGIFNKFLGNDWTFLEFETEAEAIDFARENLPITKETTDPDYFVQCYIFSQGALSWKNDNLNYFSYKLA